MPEAKRRRESFGERRDRRAAVEDPEVVLEAAGRFLETRARSVAEVRRRLSLAGYRSELIDGAIDRLLNLGILDDHAFAESWIASRDRARPRGQRALRQELLQKGIDRRLIDELLEARRSSGEVDSGDPDEAAARRLLERSARRLARVADPRQRRARAYALLARNGFDPETCRDVAAQVDGPDNSEAVPESR